MYRQKRDRPTMKREKPETSTSKKSIEEKHDLAYYIDDRVALIQQAFSMMSLKELKSIAPGCVSHLSADEIQEMCLEELLGISSKRLCATLDGAEPPTDTESSSSDGGMQQLETISLDTISSDEEVLEEITHKSKKHKHKHKKSRKRRRKRRRDSSDPSESTAEEQVDNEQGVVTVSALELIKNDIIRKQLEKDRRALAERASVGGERSRRSSGEVEIKEEPPEVLVISSDEETHHKKEIEILPSTSKEDTHAVTKVTDNLIVTVPQKKSTKKIKLTRPKTVETGATHSGKSQEPNSTKLDAGVKDIDNDDTSRTHDSEVNKNTDKPEKEKRRHKKHKRKRPDIAISDPDEITLQLSDTEMRLLEEYDRKVVEDRSSSSEDTVNCIEEDVPEKTVVHKKSTNCSPRDKELERRKEMSPQKNVALKEYVNKPTDDMEEELTKQSCNKDKSPTKVVNKSDGEITDDEESTANRNNRDGLSDGEISCDDFSRNEDSRHNSKTDDSFIDSDVTREESKILDQNKRTNTGETSSNETVRIDDASSSVDSKNDINSLESAGIIKSLRLDENSSVKEKDEDIEFIDERQAKSGEINEKKDISVCKENNILNNDINSKITDETRNVVSISDDEDDKIKRKLCGEVVTNEEQNTTIPNEDSDNDVYEVLEISDDSSDFEVNGHLVLSKEPTAQEIEALSARVDEIKREEVVTDEQIAEHERLRASKCETQEADEVGDISWKDRYVRSTKVVKVLSVAKLLNALRKKNKEVKNKLEQAKNAIDDDKVEVVATEEPEIVEMGTIEHYNLLEGSTKYVDPVCEKKDGELKVNETEVETDGQDVNKIDKVTREMATDAKKLLKMYKRLIKYNDMYKEKDKKKKKKSKKKSKEKDKVAGEQRTVSDENSETCEINKELNEVPISNVV